MKGPRRHERNEKKGNRFGGSKAPKTPVSVGEEYNVKIEEMSRQGMGVAKIDGFVILVNNTKPEDRVMIRITKVGSGFAAAEIFSQNIKKDTMQEMVQMKPNSRKTEKKTCQRTEDALLSYAGFLPG